MSNSKNKHLDFEINLLPFISILAVCISFLLISAVWLHTGSVSVKQALGTDESIPGKKDSSIWIYFQDNGATQLTVKNNSKLNNSLLALSIPALISKKVDVALLEKSIHKIKKADPQIRMALVLPSANSGYEDVVQVMGILKKYNISEVGIAPL
jgi:biopolymer transport protein ExbD